jgi:flagellar FliJ protein
MTRIERLDPIVSHTDKKQRLALQAVALSQSELEVEITKIGQLKSYKTEYLNKQAEKNKVYSAITLQEFIRFIDQLDQTIERQNEVIEMRRRTLDQKRLIWQSTRMNSKAMHKVVDNLHQAERVLEEKMEQKVMDELSQRKTLK